MKSFEVGCAIIEKQGKLLISQRKPDVFLGGYWEFPGGKQEPGESMPDCIVREVREELGIEVKVRRLLKRSEHVYPEKTVVLHFYLCDWASGDPKCIDCNDFRWIEPDELPQFKFPEGDEAMIEDLQRNQAKYFNLA